MEIILDQDKLRGGGERGLGVLVTMKQPNTLTVLGRFASVSASLNLPQLESVGLPSPDWASTIDEASGHFPGGCGVCEGVWVCLDPATTASDVWTTLITKTHLLEVLNPVVFVVLRTDEREVECFHVSGEGGLSSGPVEVSTPSLKTHLTDSTLLCRLCTFTHLYLSKEQPVSTASAEGLLTDPSTVFCVPSKPPLVFSESTPVETTVRRLLKTRSASPALSLGTSSSQHLAHSLPVSLQLLTDHCQLASSPSLSLSPPLSSDCFKVGVSVDCLVLADLDSPLSQLAATCREKMIAHLKSLSKRITWKEGCACTLRTHHVALSDHHCPVTIVYPHTAHSWEDPADSCSLLLSTEELRPYREGLHKTLCVGTDMPYFRVPRQSPKQDRPFLSSNVTLSTGPQLLNPHLHLKQAAKSGSVATVQGDYLYYHYQQGGVDDKNWGCAYRSLQTLWSWFWLQGYTEQPPPTHREIQKGVVDARERDSSLIGSKQWLGSLEVGSSLNQLLGLTYKIKDTRDMSSVGRILLEHFRTQGTPVMIGGGVLAHTILGVDFNDLTGEIKFLVLDPHYTGRDDMKLITDKGKWCGWKPISFWDPKTFYNLCMPLRPLGIV